MKENVQEFFKKMTFARWTAVLLALLTLFTAFAFFKDDPFWMTDVLKDTKEELVQAEEKLAELVKKEADTQKAHDELKEEYTLKTAELENAVEEANKTLDKMCSESSFHSYSRYYDCYDNNFKCEPLHDAVEKAEEDLEKYQNTTSRKITEYANELDSLKYSIENAKNNITSLENRITDLKESLADAVFYCICVVVTVAGLGGFAAYLYLNLSIRLLGLASAGTAVLGSVLSLFATEIFFLLNPYLYGAIAFAMLGVIIAKKSEEDLVPYRVIAIIATLVSALIVVAVGNVLAGLLFAVTMILTAFVLVPLVFEEYIKIAKHIFLTVITCGIWLFVWIFNVTKNLNKVSSLEKRTPVNELLLCLFLPFYFIYWLYKNAEYIEFYGSENGVAMNKISILCFVLGFVCPFLSTILMQDKINQIVGKPEAKEETPNSAE